MQDKKIVWTGTNQIQISDFIGSEDFWHKNSVLFVQQGNALLKIEKGETLILHENGTLDCSR